MAALATIEFGNIDKLDHFDHVKTFFLEDQNDLTYQPGPVMPPFFILKDMITQCFLTAVVSFAINFSLADLFSKKHRYKININQELFAYGSTNIFTGFFPCFATGASLARSCVQNNAGGKTQVFIYIHFY